jgi:hypothetical protein
MNKMKNIFYLLLVLIIELSCGSDKTNIKSLKLENINNNNNLEIWDGFACGNISKNIIYSFDSLHYVKVTLNQLNEGVFKLPDDIKNVNAKLIFFNTVHVNDRFIAECSDIRVIDIEKKYVTTDTLDCKSGHLTIKIENYTSNTEFVYSLMIKDAFFESNNKKFNKKISYLYSNKILYSAIN